MITLRKKAIFALSLVIITAFMFVMLSEGVVRLRQWMKYGMVGSIEDILYVDPTYSLRIPKANEVKGGIRINSTGFRGPEITNPKPYPTVRIAFLGASTTFCAEASSNETTWPHLVWEQLQDARPDMQFDYVNAAVPGYTVNASIRNLKYRVKPLQPDIIIIYHATNDFSKDSRKLAKAQGMYKDSDKKKGWGKYLLFWSLVEKNLTIRLRKNKALKSNRLTLDPKQLTRDFKERLSKLVQEGQEVAKLVAIATFSPKIRRDQPPDEQSRAANTALYYMPYMSVEGLLDGYEEYNMVIREVAKETGALLIKGEMNIPGDDTFFHDSVHFTDLGNRLMAKRVSDALLDFNKFELIIKSKEKGDPI